MWSKEIKELKELNERLLIDNKQFRDEYKSLLIEYEKLIASYKNVTPIKSHDS